jgi:hypothetical protein
MKSSVQVGEIFAGITSNMMRYVAERHGDKAMQHLFFELYDHTFTFLEREYGAAAVEAFWNWIADEQLGSLEHLMRTRGFAGMAEYWQATIEQEGATYDVQVSDDSFFLRVNRCPPNEWFRTRGIAKYPRYCEHCRVLYQRVAERCGFAMEYFPPDEAAGLCCGLRFTRRKED